jgi:hypothetical protein
MAASKSTVIWLKLVELNNFPEYLKTDLFLNYKSELLEIMLKMLSDEIETERSNTKENLEEKNNLKN